MLYDVLWWFWYMVILIWWFYVKLVELRGGSTCCSVCIWKRKKNRKELFYPTLLYKNHHTKSRRSPNKTTIRIIKNNQNSHDFGVYRVTLYMVLIWWFWYGGFMWRWWKEVDPAVVVYVFGRKTKKKIERKFFHPALLHKNHHKKSPYKIIIQNYLQDHEHHPTKTP